MMATNVADDLIPLLLATLNNPSINFLRMAAIDPQGRCLDRLAEKFEDWRVEGRKIEHNYTVKVAPKAKGRKRKGKRFNPYKLPKEWEKFKPQPDDSADQLDLKRLAQDVLTQERFLDTMYELENAEFLTKEQIDHIEAVRRAGIQQERDELVRQDQEDAEERRRDAEEGTSSEDLRPVGESDTSGNGWIGTDSDDGNDGDGGNSSSAKKVKGNEKGVEQPRKARQATEDTDTAGALVLNNSDSDKGDVGDDSDSSDESPMKKVKGNKEGAAKPVKKPRKARQAMETTDKAGASGLSDDDLIGNDGDDDSDGGDESPAKKVRGNKEGVPKPVKKPRKARQATEATIKAGASGLNDDDLVANDSGDESPAKKVKGNEEEIKKPIKRPVKARQAKKDTDGAGASGLNDNDLIQNDSEEEQPKPEQKGVRKPRAPAASKAKGKVVPTAPLVEEKPMKKGKADARAIKASRKAAAISGVGGESGNQLREEKDV